MNVLGFGAILWDDIREDGEPPDPNSLTAETNIGGAVFNVIVHMQKFGYEGYMLSAIGNDKLGEKTFKEVNRLNIHREFISTVQAPTCLIKVTFNEDGFPHYSSPDLVSWDQIEIEEDDIRKINDLDFDFLVYGTLEQRNAVSRNTLQKVLANAHFKSVYTDLTLRGGFYDRELLGYSIGKANIVKMNDEEARVLNKLFGFNQKEVQGLIPIIAREFNTDIVCITLGEYGAYIGDPSTTVYKPGYKNTVKDTVGCGDAFSAGLLYKLGNGSTIAEACEFGNKMGALISSKKSSIPDYDLSELENFDMPPVR